VLTLTRVLNGVLFSAFASLQERHDELRRLLLKVYRYDAIIIFPMMVGLALVAEDFIMVAYGEKWMPILMPLRLFCLVGMLQMFTQPLYPLCNAIGKPQLPFRWALIYLPVNVATIYAGVTLAGMTGVVAGRAVLPVFMIATVGREVMRHIGLPWRQIFRTSLPALLGCTAMAAAVWTFWRFDLHLADAPIVHLVTEVAVGAVVYVVFMGLFFRGQLMELVNQLRKR
jgi:O-antigen/teichoic acid export membrane protein